MELELTDELCNESPFFKALKENPSMAPEISPLTAALATLLTMPHKELKHELEKVYGLSPSYLFLKLGCMCPDERAFKLLDNPTHQRMFLQQHKFPFSKFVELVSLDKIGEFSDYVDVNGRTLLMHACNTNNTELAMKLLENPKCNTTQTDSYGDTALILACNNKMESVAQKLATMDCNPNAINKRNNTALLIACLSNMEDVALKLLAKPSCNVGHADMSNHTPLYFACMNGMEKVAMKILSFGNACNPGVVNTDTGQTTLMSACRQKMNTVALKLLELDCNIGQSNIHGDTALTWACLHKMENVALLMLDNPACNVTQVSKNGYTALIHALISRLESVAMKMLTQYKVPLNALSRKHRDTALLLACDYGFEQVALKILDSPDCLPGHVNINGATALTLACNKKLPAVAMKLLDMDCNPLQFYKNGKTAEVYARENKLVEVEAKIKEVTAKLLA